MAALEKRSMVKRRNEYRGTAEFSEAWFFGIMTFRELFAWKEPGQFIAAPALPSTVALAANS